MIPELEGEPPDWADAALGAAVFAVDPSGLGGIVVRARHGAPRERWLEHLQSLLDPAAALQRVPASVSDEQLLGGLDLVATLERGKVVAKMGLLARADGGVAILPTAERLHPSTAAHLAAALDLEALAIERDGYSLRVCSRFGCVALDEGIELDEHAPRVLLERLALRIDLEPCRDSFSCEGLYARPDIAAAAQLLPRVRIATRAMRALCSAAQTLGIESLRAPIAAARVARIVAALDGRRLVVADDAALAARLVLSWRATRVPVVDEAPGSQTSEPEEQEKEHGTPEGSSSSVETLANSQGLEDRVLDSARAAIPPEILAQSASAPGGRRARESGRVGALRASNRRGRPAGTVRGTPVRGARLNVLDTLRAAAPWQRVRGGDGSRVIVHRDDMRVSRFKCHARTTIIFAVDASGSQAMNRLAEVKGAVELMLADCYIRRDRVALIAFRGRSAEELLAPTRSLVRAKRSLAALPGGGGTPLALGIGAAGALAEVCRRAGDTPLVVLLTDGRANVAADGVGGRDAAQRDARCAAEALAATGCDAVVVDTGRDPGSLAAELAQALRARYVPLPHATSASLSRAVQRVTPARRG